MDALSWLTAFLVSVAFVLAVVATVRDDGRFAVAATLALALWLAISDCATVVVVQATGAVDAPSSASSQPSDGGAR